MTLGQHLRRAREAQGYSLRTFAVLLMVSPSYLSDVETDRRGIAHRKIQWFADNYRVSRRDLLALAGLCAHCEGTGKR